MRNILFSGLLILGVFAAANAQQFRGPQEFSGTIVGSGGSLGWRTYQFTLTVDRFTPDPEASSDAEILRSLGQGALLDTIRDQRVGTFSLVGQPGRNVNLVRVRRMADARLRIVAVFERWGSAYDVRPGTRSQDYPFTYIEIYVDENGRGEGKLIPAARIYFDKKDHNQIDAENFGVFPARLMSVEWCTRPPKIAE